MVRHRDLNPDLIRIALQDTGSVTAAAARLGVSRRTLHRWLRVLDIRVERHVVTAVGDQEAAA